GDIGRGVGQVAEVDRALRLQRLARIGGDGGGHVEQALLAPARGDDDIALARRVRLLRGGIGGGGVVLRQRRQRRQRGERHAQVQQGACTGISACHLRSTSP